MIPRLPKLPSLPSLSRLRLPAFLFSGRGALAALLTLDAVLIGAILVLYSLGSEEKQLRLAAQSLVDSMAGELIVAHDKLAEAQMKLESADSEKQVLLSEIAQRDSAIHEMGVELAQLKMKSGRVDLGRIVIAGQARKKAIAEAPRSPGPASSPQADSGQAAAQGTTPAEGEVLSLNKEFNFVIVNLGSKDGLTEGMTLELARDGETVGARVDMVDETTCAAAVLTGSLKEVRVGDAVRAPKS